MKRSTVYFNDKYLEVISWVNGGVYIFNYDFDPLLLLVDVQNEELGISIRKALENSHVISGEMVNKYLFSSIYKEQLENRKHRLMKTYGYKSSKSLFRNMRDVSIELSDKFSISASHQDGLDFSFTGINNLDDFILGINCSDEELGRTVRLAYEKCTSIY